MSTMAVQFYIEEGLKDDAREFAQRAIKKFRLILSNHADAVDENPPAVVMLFNKNLDPSGDKLKIVIHAHDVPSRREQLERIQLEIRRFIASEFPEGVTASITIILGQVKAVNILV